MACAASPINTELSLCKGRHLTQIRGEVGLAKNCFTGGRGKINTLFVSRSSDDPTFTWSSIFGIRVIASGKNFSKNSFTCSLVFNFLKFFQGINRVTVNVLSRLGNAIIMKSPKE